MMFPTLVYKSPGPHRCATNGKKSYDYVGVEDQQAFDERIAQGWFATAQEAMFPKEVEAPPTREEIEKMAKDLDIKFDGRTSDKKLLKLIDDKLEEDRGMD
jgi:hypothetical protein